MISLNDLPSNIHIYDFGDQKWVSIRCNDGEVHNYGPNDAPILRLLADLLDKENIKKVQPISDSHIDLEDYYQD